MPRIGQDGVLVGLDWRVLLFTAALSIGTGILFGLLPALQSSRTDLTTALKDSTGRSGATLRHNKARSTLVVVEVALALLLLVGSALLIRTLVNLRNVQPGYDPTNILTMRMSLTGEEYTRRPRRSNNWYATGSSVFRHSLVCKAAAATCCVLAQGGYGLPFRIIGRPLEEGAVPWRRLVVDRLAELLYFDVFKIAISAAAHSTIATMPERLVS